MRNSSKDLSVFEFRTDEANEMGDKLNNYQFLQFFTSRYHQLKTPDDSNQPPIDLHEVDSPERSTPGRNLVSTEEMSELDDVKACSTSYAHTKTCTSNFRPGSVLHEDSLVTGASRNPVASDYDGERPMLHSSALRVNLLSNEEESCTSVSEASSTSGDLTDTGGHPECLVFKHCHSTFPEMDDNKNIVVVCPDYVIYRNQIFLESQLTFYSDCIKIECSEACQTEEKLILVCDIAKIVRICSQWSTSVDALLFKFWVNTDSENDPEKFVASLADVFWREKELRIKSLAERYKDIWDSLTDNNYALEDERFRKHMSFSKRYFTEIMEPFEDVIYPKGDPDAVSISKRDFELLEPDKFINDTIIDFYIKYLQDKVQPIEKSRFHFFNCFFFRKLADLDKDPGSISEGMAAYQRVRKWTRKLNIFEKDYIFIPVNFNLHWSLLVICHPGEIITFEDDHLRSSPKVPCVLHMDSFKGSHKGLEKLIRSYLFEEWKGRHSEFPDDIASRFSSLRFVHLELPQQENSTDCGLFLLHYVELFLGEAPLYFNPTKITSLSNFLSADWFPPSEASFKRFLIRGLLYEILRDSSQKPASSSEEFPSFGDVANDDYEAVEFLSAQDSPSKSVNGSSSMPPVAAQDDICEQTASFKSGPVTPPLEGHGDVMAHATEQIDGDGGADSAERLVPIVSPTLQIYSTPFDENPSMSKQVKEEVVDILSTSSNDKREIRELTSPTVDYCHFVPDTPDISNQQPENYVKNSQGNVTSEIIVVENHVDPEVHCGSDENCLEACPSGTETRHNEDRVCPHESDETPVGGCKTQDDILVENLHGGDIEMGGYEDDGEVADSQENNVVMEISKEDMLCPHDSDVTEVILSDNEVTPPKRSKISGAVHRSSKRQKLEQYNKRNMVTRSSIRKRGA